MFRIYSTRLMNFLHGKQGVHFLHIRKTGGTAVKHPLKNHLRTRRYLIHLHRHNVKLKDVPVGDKVFFFLRDPVSRFVSGFYSKQRRGRPRYSSRWSSGERIAFRQYQTPNELASALSSENPRQRQQAVQAMKSIAHVKSSYWDWFDSESYFRSRRSDIILIGFQETLSADFERLKMKLELPQSVKLPTDEIKAHRNPPDLDTNLDEQAIKNLKSWYARDYAFIRLCKEVGSL